MIYYIYTSVLILFVFSRLKLNPGAGRKKAHAIPVPSYKNMYALLKMCVCMYVCMYVCVYIYMCMHIYIYMYWYIYIIMIFFYNYYYYCSALHVCTYEKLILYSVF